MPKFADFRVKLPLPAAVTWPALAPSVTHRYPPPVATGTTCPSPWKLATAPVSLAPSDLALRMIAVGYGEYAHYGVMWLLKGKTLSPAHIQDLRRLTTARMSLVHRAYQTISVSFAGTTSVGLQRREIYPLIESSEQGAISYVLGCAMAEVCAPLALQTRPLGAMHAPIWHLFHVKLIAAANLCGNVIQVQMKSKKKIDFLAIDPKLGTVHLFEAKGSGDGFDASRVHEGLSQCADVTGIQVNGGLSEPVASLNVCTSYVHQRYVKTAVFELLPEPKSPSSGAAAQHPARSRNVAISEAVDILFATKLTGLYLMLRSSASDSGQPQDGGWTIFSLRVEDSDDGRASLLFSMPTKLWTLMEQFWSGAEDAMTTISNYAALQRKLPGVRRPTDGEILNMRKYELSNRLRRFGVDAAEQLGPSRAEQENEVHEAEPPAGFRRSELEPWLAFGVPE